MSRLAKCEVRESAVRGNSYGLRWDDRFGYWQGFVVTPHGVCGVYAQEGYTSVFVVHSGRFHEALRREPGRMTRAGITRLCHAFARYVVTGDERP